MDELSSEDQDAIVVELAVNIESLSEEEFEELYDQLDFDHQMEVRNDIANFADNAIGSDMWRADEG